MAHRTFDTPAIRAITGHSMHRNVMQEIDNV